MASKVRPPVVADGDFALEPAEEVDPFLACVVLID